MAVNYKNTCVKPAVVLIFIVLVGATVSSEGKKIGRVGGGRVDRGGDGDGRGASFAKVWGWFYNVTERIDKVVDMANRAGNIFEKWPRESYVDIKNDCTDCQLVYIQCSTSENGNHDPSWFTVGNSVRYNYGFRYDLLLHRQLDLVVTCYVDFGKPSWPHSKGYFAALIKDRCIHCNWRLNNGGTVELSAEDGFQRTYELQGDPSSAKNCLEEKCR